MEETERAYIELIHSSERDKEVLGLFWQIVKRHAPAPEENQNLSFDLCIQPKEWERPLTWPHFGEISEQYNHKESKS